MKSRKSIVLISLFAVGCSDGEGEVEIRTWGEAYIEEGIPADVMTDGWAIEFSRFEIVLTDVSIAGADLDDPGPIDLVEPSEGIGQLVGRATVPAGDHSDAAFTLTSVTVEGSASKAGETKSFTWVFDTPVDFYDCEARTTVPKGGSGEFQITVHADHLFYDSTVSMDPALRFDPIAAADADADGVVTTQELAATDIGPYDPGNLPIDDLWSFMAAQATTMGHADGEGHCISTSE